MTNIKTLPADRNSTKLSSNHCHLSSGFENILQQLTSSIHYIAYYYYAENFSVLALRTLVCFWIVEKVVKDRVVPDVLRDELAGLAGCAVLHAHGVVQRIARELLHAARERGGEQQRLPVRTYVVADRTHLRFCIFLNVYI